MEKIIRRKDIEGFNKVEQLTENIITYFRGFRSCWWDISSISPDNETVSMLIEVLMYPKAIYEYFGYYDVIYDNDIDKCSSVSYETLKNLLSWCKINANKAEDMLKSRGILRNIYIEEEEYNIRIEYIRRLHLILYNLPMELAITLKNICKSIYDGKIFCWKLSDSITKNQPVDIIRRLPSNFNLSTCKEEFQKCITRFSVNKTVNDRRDYIELVKEMNRISVINDISTLYEKDGNYFIYRHWDNVLSEIKVVFQSDITDKVIYGSLSKYCIKPYTTERSNFHNGFEHSYMFDPSNTIAYNPYTETLYVKCR